MADYDDESLSESSSNPDFKKVCRRIRSMRKLRKDWEKDFNVEQCERFYLGKQNRDGTNRRTFNHFLATIRSTQPNLLFENPKFLVRVKGQRPTPQTSQEASVAESVLDAILQQDDHFQSVSALALLQNFFRIGVLKVVYEPNIVPNERAGQPIMRQDPDGNVVLDPETMAPVPEMDPATGQPILEPDEIIKDDTYRFEWVDARNMLLPDYGPDMRKWPYLAEEIVVPLEDAQTDPRFAPELAAQLKPNVEKFTSQSDDKEKAQDDDGEECDKFVRLVEFYDIRAQKWYIVAEGQDFEDFLLEDFTPDGIEDHPYAILPGWLPIIGPDPLPWPIPYTQPWLDPAEEYNIRRNQQSQGAKRSARKIFYTNDMFESTDEAVLALQSSNDMEAVMVRDIQRIPVFGQEPNINPAIWMDTPNLLNDYRIITGQTGAKLGAPDADSATEATFVQQASQLRDVELQKAVRKWIKVAGKKMLQLVKSTLTVQLYVKMRGLNDQEVTNVLASRFGIQPDMLQLVPQLKELMIARFGQEQMTAITREDLQFEADVDVIPGSTRPRTLQAEKAEFLEFLQIFFQAPQMALSPGLMNELAQKYEFLNKTTIDEMQQLALMLIGINANQAGRSQGGAGGAPENTPGQGPSDADQAKSDVSEAGGGFV